MSLAVDSTPQKNITDGKAAQKHMHKHLQKYSLSLHCFICDYKHNFIKYSKCSEKNIKQY